MDGARVEKILDMASITLNKNSVPGEPLPLKIELVEQRLEL